MTPFFKVSPGQKLKASAHRENMISDLLRNHQQQRTVGPPSVRTSKAGGPRIVTFKIDGPSSTQLPAYNVKTFSGAIDAAETGALTEADLGTLSTTVDAIAWHEPEVYFGGAGVARLRAGSICSGIDTGRTNPDGLRIIRFSILPIGEIATAQVMGGTTEGNEAAEADTWSRTDDGRPLNIWIQTRQAYFAAGDQKWWAYARMFSYDAIGMLIAVSAETRIEIDPPEECDTP